MARHWLRWRDEESFQALRVNSPGFAEGHRWGDEREQGSDAPRAVSTHSEVWSYEVAGGSDPKPA